VGPSIVLFLHLTVFWLLCSGRRDPLLLAFGLVSCVAVVLLTRRLGIVDQESLPVHLGVRPFLYLPWLLWEIAKSNVAVARVVLSPSLPIHPRLVRVPSSQRSEVGRVLFANSITLTPGTISLDVQPGEILVHALTRESAHGVLSGEMDRRVTALETTG
jgi:multicomponent Na+:H+ antiporter subunit E